MVSYEVHYSWASVEPFSEYKDACVFYEEILEEPVESIEFAEVSLREKHEESGLDNLIAYDERKVVKDG